MTERPRSNGRSSLNCARMDALRNNDNATETGKQRPFTFASSPAVAGAACFLEGAAFGGAGLEDVSVAGCDGKRGGASFGLMGATSLVTLSGCAIKHLRRPTSQT
jgi:hypothetical protein